jgi:hypothetical protein
VYVKERKREKAVWSILHSVYLNVSKVTITVNLLVDYVTSEREKNNTAGKDMASVVVRLALYPLEMTQDCEILLVQNCFQVEEAGILGF